MNLIIVESPTKAKTLGRFLGSDYSVEATMGHIKDLPKSQLGVDVEHNFKPEYVDVEKRKETIDELKTKSKKAKVIYIATDPDREGEAIAAHVQQILSDSILGDKTRGKKRIISQYPNIPISRITFHEITKEAVEDALKSPRGVDEHLVDAQTARRVLDRLVGYKLSPLLWKKIRVGLSAGRVQSVAVRLIVEREREIEKFKAEEYWEIFSKVKSEKRITSSAEKVKSEFVIQLVKVGEKTPDVKTKKDSDKILADLKKSRYEITEVRKREVSKNPYPPFTTSTMTQAAARIFGWSSKKTMSVAQKLYEEGLITYHRTDSFNLSAAAVLKARNYIRKTFGADYLPESPRVYKTQSKVAQEAHEAIRPTNVTNREGASADQQDFARLYDLIWRRFVACQMVASVSDETTIDVSASQYLLRASGQVMKFDGWRKVIPAKKAYGPDLRFGEPQGSEKGLRPVGDAEGVIVLPEVEKGELLDLIKTWGEQKFTQAPARYNEASLIKTLEKLGIGRPSTYAPTISTIQVRSYVEKTEGKFFATPVGVAVSDFLVENFPGIFDYQFTAKMEGELDDIANGDLAWEKPIKEFYSPFEKKLKDVTKNSKRVKIAVEKLGKKCPKCDKGELVIRIGRFGKFISCSRFPDCDFTDKYIEKVGMVCPECKKGDVIIKKTGKGRQFFGCSRYPDCKWASWRNPKVNKVINSVNQ